MSSRRKHKDRPATPRQSEEQAEVLRRVWSCGRPVWVAASTHEGEEELLLVVHTQVRATLPDALLVLVPRHPDRFDAVAALVQRAGLTMARRSAGNPCRDDTAVYWRHLGAPDFLAAADVAFIGGSLVRVGGHNLLEAAVVGVRAIIGPYSHNSPASPG